jgi:predicted GIY-YIG superfamily endonuclease
MKTFRCVYVLQSETDSKRFYTGCTLDLRKRLARHNNGEVPHTSKWRPWRVKTYIAFSDRVQAKAFEHYLKSASGRAFLKKRLENQSDQIGERTRLACWRWRLAIANFLIVY